MISKLMRKALSIGIAIFIIFLSVGGLFVYSYTQLSVSLNDVRFHSIDWATISWSTLINLGLDTLTPSLYSLRDKPF